MVYTVNKLLASDNKDLRDIGNLLYYRDNREGGLTADETERLAELVLDVGTAAFDKGYATAEKEVSEAAYLSGYEDGLALGAMRK